MSDIEDRLKRIMQPADDNAPDFDAVFGKAEARLGSLRLRRRSVLGLAAAAALAAVILPWQGTESPGLIIDDELFGTTSWSPPSDVLLPSRGTDVFYDLPELHESTKPVGGTLL